MQKGILPTSAAYAPVRSAEEHDSSPLEQDGAGHARSDGDEHDAGEDPLEVILKSVPEGDPEGGGIKNDQRPEGNKYEDMTVGQVVVDMEMFRKKGLADVIPIPDGVAIADASTYIQWRKDEVAASRSSQYLWVIGKIASSLISFCFINLISLSYISVMPLRNTFVCRSWDGSGIRGCGEEEDSNESYPYQRIPAPYSGR